MDIPDLLCHCITRTSWCVRCCSTSHTILFYFCLCNSTFYFKSLLRVEGLRAISIRHRFCAFAQLLGEKYHFVPWKVLWLDALLGSKCRVWRNLLWWIFSHLIALSISGCTSPAPFFRTLAPGRIIIFSTWVTKILKSIRVLRRRQFSFMHQHSISLYQPFSSDWTTAGVIYFIFHADRTSCWSYSCTSLKCNLILAEICWNTKFCWKVTLTLASRF